MTYERLGVSGLLLLSLGAVRCSNGTETDNPGTSDVSFLGSQCHHEGTSHDSGPPPSNGSRALEGVGRSAARLTIEGDYTRLACVAWRREEETLHVSYRNYRAACGIQWSGAHFSLEESEDVRLFAHNPGCVAARCGACFYDLEFEVPGVPGSGYLEVTAEVTDEDGTKCSDGMEGSVTGIQPDEESGVRCRRIEPEAFTPPPAECERYAACSDACTCAIGTRCASDGTGLPTTCIPECDREEDCPVPGAFECKDGLCKTKT